ncbi:hypothetical protein QEG73_21885 [Chitinophagaceae bacterium 26-R-25]|nr:hypothetical protein [Chitinophagaceae bacterium 26-R-25]
MALIKTIDEIKAVLKISNLDDNTSIPDVESAEETYFIPLLGNELYEQIQAAYDGNSLNPDQTKLLSKIQKPLAAIAFYDELAIIHGKITEAGVRRTTTDSMPAAYRWEFESVKDYLSNRYYQGIESMLKFLESNKDKFPVWVDGSGYKRRTRYLLKDPIEYSDNYMLQHPYQTYNSLLGVMGDVESIYINPSIGKAFFDSLKALVTPSDDEKFVIEKLKKSIAHFCIKHAVEKLPVEISDAGFTVKNGTVDSKDAGKDPANGDQLNLLMQACDRDGNTYLTAAIDYLNATASESAFTIFFESDFYVAPSPPSQPKPDPNAGKKIFRF